MDTQPSRSSNAALSARFQTFDLLATLVAVVRSDGVVLFANSALEDALGSSRRNIVGCPFPDVFTEPAVLLNALAGVGVNRLTALRYDAWLRRQNLESLPVHVVLAQSDQPGEVIIELSGGKSVAAIVTNDSIKSLGLKEGVKAAALIKASHVILAVNA